MKKILDFIAAESRPCPIGSCEYGKIWKIQKDFCDEHIKLLEECDIGMLEHALTSEQRRILEDKYPSLRPTAITSNFERAARRTAKFGAIMAASGSILLLLGLYENIAAALVGIVGGGAITMGLLKIWSIRFLREDAYGSSNDGKR